MIKSIFITLLVLKALGVISTSWFWVIVWGIMALNWSIIKAIIKAGLKK